MEIRVCSFKTIESWQQPRAPEPVVVGDYDTLPCIFQQQEHGAMTVDCVVKELVRDYISDMEFIPFDSKVDNKRLKWKYLLLR